MKTMINILFCCLLPSFILTPSEASAQGWCSDNCASYGYFCQGGAASFLYPCEETDKASYAGSQCCVDQDPYGFLYGGGKECGVERTRPECCGNKRWDCKQNCDSLTDPSREAECYRGCDHEYSNCLSTGEFTDG